ncbi:hypothetical protein MLD38_001160 [Melastoma candidum]|uniref:Uncharacterized protein n=1 Tax=Melastoma candidum TaxID=119954 RepID=A0ACB9SCE7_9MYRT|nr:hypothetical protein MLD38_001160 [Melastoma candidum]
MLHKAIKESRFCIVVFSPNYASSSWCLGELEKIYDCTVSKGLQTVLPVFYGVDPTHVRRQTGCFEKAFSDHEAAYGKDSDKVFKWRQALKEIANLSGWDIENKPESVVIEEIVRKVFNEVNFELPSEYPSLVGMGSRAGGLKIKLLGSPDDVLVVGIPEMGGVGKTTIARVVYDTIRFEFDGCSFLANVSEISKKRGIMYLQEQLLRDILKDKKTRVNDAYQGVSMIKKSLSSRKVLVVLDDVAESDQLAALAGNFHWFGPGSRVIITTRDQHLLVQHGVGEFFYPKKLDHDESLHLFSLRAFKRDRPPELYLQLSIEGSELVEGLFLQDTNGISSTKIEALDVDAKTLRKMNRLRLLKLEDVDLSGDLRYLSGEIRFLHWDSYQKKSLPDGFQSNKLVDLGLRHSLIEKLSLDEKPMENLKYLDLSHSTRLIDTPDFSLLPNLEELLLVGCVGLYRLHPSIGLLEKLVMLNLSGCRNLLELPSSISGLCSLKYLDLFACSKLAQLPEAICHLQCLEELDLGHTMIHPPYFLTRLKNLKGLSFSGCEGQLSQTWHSFISSFFRKRDSPEPRRFPLTMLSNFCKLKRLDLSDCNVSDHAEPIDLSCLSLLEQLDLTGNNFTRLPFDVSRLQKLESLGLESCERLEALPSLPCGMRMVIANHCSSLKMLPDEIGVALSRKCEFSFVNCHKLDNFSSNRVADRLLRSLLQNQFKTGSKEPQPGRPSNFQIPGCEVPRWFICRSDGRDNATIQMGSGWFDDFFQGFIVSAVFEDAGLGNSSSSYYEFSYSIGVDRKVQFPSTSFLMSKSYGTINSKHLWLSFISQRRWLLYSEFPQDDGRCQVQVQFYSCNPDIRVISCGIHPVYSEGGKGPSEVGEIQWSSSVNFGHNIIPSHLELPAVGDGCRMKRDRDFPHSIGNGQKLIANNSFDDKAHLKRFKEL